MKIVIFYEPNDKTFFDGTNKIIHLKHLMETNGCKKPELIPGKVMDSFVKRLEYEVFVEKMILCPLCFKGLTFVNFIDVPSLHFNECIIKSKENEKELKNSLKK
ncbi:MAG: hypothetical protein ACRC51_04170 [Cetobacterium sp.]